MSNDKCGPAGHQLIHTLLHDALCAGIDGRGVGNEAPAADFEGMPRLTPKMMARLQGFPDDWQFGSKKTTACRMIGNAFPPPVAKEVGLMIKQVLDYASIDSRSETQVPCRVVS